MIIDQLVIEVTRKCNMKCAHCLRGPAEYTDINKETMRKFLVDNNIEYICSITFSGGEPSLNIKAIYDFMNICKIHNIEVGSFYIVTNAKSVWHSEQGQDMKGIEKLKCLQFVNTRPFLGFENLRKEGNAKENGYSGLKTEQTEFFIEDNRVENIYLNVNGDILSDCNYSYETQKKYKHGNIYKTTLINILKTRYWRKLK